MSLKDRLRRQLEQTRAYSERLLAAFHTPEQWTHQVHERANHALWFAGHMGVTDNFFISLVDPSLAREQEDFPAKFGIGSQPTSNPADYPASGEVLTYMRDRRGTFLALLDRMSDEELARPMPAGTPDFLPDVGSVFQAAAWHEGLHVGQVTVAHRALGHDPFVLAPPKASH
ncbi:MAG: DinB family protein [Pirellulales bacterium]|nr:DinB family protein [Pirellulales bacterium]